MLPEMTLAEAAWRLRKIEQECHAIYRNARLPERIRRRVKDCAAQAHDTKTLVDKEQRRLRLASHITD